MKKWIEKHRDKTHLILLTIIGLTIITITYVKSFIDGMVTVSYTHLRAHET